MKKIVNNKNYFDTLFLNVENLIEVSRNRVYENINTEMITLYWNIGKIVSALENPNLKIFEPEVILLQLSKKLSLQFGQCFSREDLLQMKKFYLYFPNHTVLSQNLSWAHYLELMRIDNKTKRQFYYQKAVQYKWSVLELRKQKESLLFEQLILSQDKETILNIALKDPLIKKKQDIIKDSFVLEFLDIKASEIIN